VIKILTKEKLSEILNSVLADEVSAWWMYWFMYQVSEGASFHAISKELEEFAKDELDDHATKLITWALSNNVYLEVMPNKLLPKANCPIEDFSCNVDTKDVVTLAILSERCAIKSYKKYYNYVRDDYPDLAHLFMEISNDEQEHLNMLLDLGKQVGVSEEVLDGTSLDGASDFESLKNRMKEVFKYGN
jgi:ferritin-like protein